MRRSSGRSSTPGRALAFVAIVLVVITIGTAAPALATTATYNGCTVTSPKPSLSADNHHVVATGSIVCNDYKTLAITVKMMVRDRPEDAWTVDDKATASGRRVIGLSATVQGDCGFHSSGTFKTVVIATINGNKKPALDSDTREC